MRQNVSPFTAQKFRTLGYLHVHVARIAVILRCQFYKIAGLMSELERGRSDHRDQVASLHTQLSSAEDQIGWVLEQTCTM